MSNTLPLYPDVPCFETTPRRMVVGGMQRSCSTWLFNVLQQFAKLAGKRCIVSRGKAPLFDGPPEDVMRIVKGHYYRPMFAPAFKMVTIRHLFDAIASSKLDRRYSKMERMLARGVKNVQTRALLDTIVKDSYEWVEHADMVLRYEDMVRDKVGHVARLAEILYPNMTVDAAEVVTYVEYLAKMGTKRQLPTLLGKDHGSGIGINGWRKHLPPAVVEFMLEEYGAWFEDHGYPKPDFEGSAHG